MAHLSAVSLFWLIVPMGGVALLSLIGWLYHVLDVSGTSSEQQS